MFVNRVLRRIFGSKTDDVTGDWIRPYALYSSPNIIWPANKKNWMTRACGTFGIRRVLYRVLVGRPEGKRPFGKPRHL